jgi:membrane-associated phospholipid phosphatase
MGSFTVWCVLTLVLIAGIGVTLWLGESTWTDGVLAPLKARGLAIVGSCALLLVLALLLKVEAIARADGSVIRVLSHSRGDTLAKIMTILTTLGDAIPSFTIATMLAVIIFRQGAHPFAWALLPVVVLAELLVQVGMTNAFGDLTIGDVAASIPVGNPGILPSGSVARLTSIFLVAALLWHGTNRLQSRTIVTIGGVLLVLQSVSRLYLGRHLLLDILGGLLLGLALALLASLVVGRPSQVDLQRGNQHHDE